MKPRIIYNDGENTLAFDMPNFPKDRDPYVYIYDLEADVSFP